MTNFEYVSEHMSRPDERDHVTPHRTWDAALGHAKEMSDKHDGLATAYKYDRPKGKLLEAVEFMFGERQ